MKKIYLLMLVLGVAAGAIVYNEYSKPRRPIVPPNAPHFSKLPTPSEQLAMWAKAAPWSLPPMTSRTKADARVPQEIEAWVIAEGELREVNLLEFAGGKKGWELLFTSPAELQKFPETANEFGQIVRSMAAAQGASVAFSRFIPVGAGLYQVRTKEFDLQYQLEFSAPAKGSAGTGALELREFVLKN